MKIHVEFVNGQSRTFVSNQFPEILPPQMLSFMKIELKDSAIQLNPDHIVSVEIETDPLEVVEVDK